ncbi:MAG: PD-(D/E)XK nuclease family protein [Steroidobacteraceae bacterium]
MPLGLIEAANAGYTVLTPNTELAVALFDALERAQRDSGRDVWPTPRVRDFGSWLREQHVRRQFADSSTPRCLSDVEEHELWRRVVLESDSSRGFLEPSGAARAVRRARRAMREYAIPESAVAGYGTEESAALLDWNARFAEQCRVLRCISADELLMRADRGRAGIEHSAEPIAWIESPLWRPAARRWLQSNAGVPLQPSAAERPGSLHVLRARSPAGELAAIAQWAQVNLQARSDFRAWICVPDLALRRAEVVDAFDAVLARQRFSLYDAPEGAVYAVAGGTPLAEHAPVRAALDLLSASAGAVSFEQFSATLRAPELHADAAEASAAARLDVALRSRAPSEALLEDWLALAERAARAVSPGPVGALRRLQTASRALADLRGNHPMSRWVSLWITAFEAGPWSLRHRWSSTEYQSAEAFRDLLGALATGDSLFGTHSRPSAQRVLRRAARDTAFQAQTGIPPIWVSGQLIDPWLSYEGLWVTGCDEERWPPPVDPLPLLPVQLQRQYGVIAAAVHSQLQFAEDLQQRWHARAARRVFSCADPGDGRSARPSPLLRSLAASPVQPQDMPEPPDMPEPQPHWFALLQSASTLEQLIDEMAPPFGADESTRGVSTLKAQSRCAFRGLAQTRLMADPLERPLPGFDDREHGELLHDALARIWADVRDSARLSALLAQAEPRDRLLNESALRAIEKLCRRRDPGARWRDRERIRLHGLLRKWLEIERERAPFEVERVEGGAQIAHHAGLKFEVRIDRVDRLEDGARVLIDYKSGVANADWRGDRPDNPQLPLYALLHPKALVAVAYGRINAAQCGFVAESERAEIFKRGGQKSKMEGMASLADLMKLWSQRIERLAAEFAAGRAAVDPTPRACRSCRLHGLCRVPSALDMSAVLEDADGP